MQQYLRKFIFAAVLADPVHFDGIRMDPKPINNRIRSHPTSENLVTLSLSIRIGVRSGFKTESNKNFRIKNRAKIRIGTDQDPYTVHCSRIIFTGVRLRVEF
jgi:hypothetical protein